jgi:hypothetical protein
MGSGRERCAKQKAACSIIQQVYGVEQSQGGPETTTLTLPEVVNLNYVAAPMNLF